MNIIIFSASTGGGHNSAANAIKNYFNQHSKEDKIKIIDTFKYINGLLDKTVSKGYFYLATKLPKVYGELYKITNDISNEYLNNVNGLFAKKLIPIIKEYKADLIITTHPFPTEMVSKLKKSGLVDIPLICIMTDYSSHNAWINDEVDNYIVSNDDMMNKMIESGIKKERIHSYGIPINEDFFVYNKKKDIYLELGFVNDMPIILMMAGSFGVYKIIDIYRYIENINKSFQMIIITGKNKRLYDEFSDAIEESKRNIKLIYFTDEVEKYMKVADIIITKPGGLTVTEALASNVPLILFNSIPGQEDENAEFLSKHNMAIRLSDDEEIINVINELLTDSNRLSNMKKACEAYDKSECCSKLYELIKSYEINK